MTILACIKVCQFGLSIEGTLLCARIGERLSHHIPARGSVEACEGIRGQIRLVTCDFEGLMHDLFSPIQHGDWSSKMVSMMYVFRFYKQMQYEGGLQAAEQFCHFHFFPVKKCTDKIPRAKCVITSCSF